MESDKATDPIAAVIKRHHQLSLDVQLATARLDQATDQLAAATSVAEKIGNDSEDLYEAIEQAASAGYLQKLDEAFTKAFAACLASADKFELFLMGYDLPENTTQEQLTEHLLRLRSMNDPRIAIPRDTWWQLAHRLQPELLTTPSWADLHAAIVRLADSGCDVAAVLYQLCAQPPLPEADPATELLWRIYAYYRPTLPPLAG